MLVTVALIFALLAPFVLAALFVVGLAFTAKWADEREEAYLSDDLECKFAGPCCDGRARSRGAAR